MLDRLLVTSWMLRSEETVSMTEDGLAFQQLESSYVTERYYLPAFLLVTWLIQPSQCKHILQIKNNNNNNLMIYFLRRSHLSWQRAAVTLTHGAFTDSQLYKIAQRPPFIMKLNCQHSEAGTWRELWGNICSLKWRGNKVVSVPPSTIRLVQWTGTHSGLQAKINAIFCAHPDFRVTFP